MRIEKWAELLINGAGVGLGIAFGSALGTVIVKWLHLDSPTKQT